MGLREQVYTSNHPAWCQASSRAVISSLSFWWVSHLEQPLLVPHPHPLALTSSPQRMCSANTPNSPLEALFVAPGVCLAHVHGKPDCWRVNAHRSSPQPRTDVRWRINTSAPSPAGGRCPVLPPRAPRGGTQPQLPTVAACLVTHAFLASFSSLSSLMPSSVWAAVTTYHRLGGL